MGHILALYEPGVQALTRALQSLADGQRPNATPQTGPAQYFSYPTEADIAQFTAHGGTVVDYPSYNDVLRRFGAD